MCYLVFKLSEKCHGLHCPVKVRDLLHWKDKETVILYFRIPSPWNLHDNHRVPEKREDGWIEVLVWKFNSTSELRKDYIPMHLKLIAYEGTMSGLTVGSREVRPIKEMETEKGEQEDEHDDDIGDQKQQHVPCSNVVNFYFMNFPTEWDKVNLYELFSEVGEIAHVYVARKVSKAGKRFGFAHFFGLDTFLLLGKD
ncbi:serine/threonine-protein kinase, active site protein [Tanacetum coccineum]